MAKIAVLSELNEWTELWRQLSEAGAAPVLIFKRSPICPTSFFVEGVFNRFIAKLPDSALKIYSVDVIGARPVSQRIAVDTGAKHESPQALLMAAGAKVLWHASHGDINDETLQQALSSAAPRA